MIEGIFVEIAPYSSCCSWGTLHLPFSSFNIEFLLPLSLLVGMVYRWTHNNWALDLRRSILTYRGVLVLLWIPFLYYILDQAKCRNYNDRSSENDSENINASEYEIVFGMENFLWMVPAIDVKSWLERRLQNKFLSTF